MLTKILRTAVNSAHIPLSLATMIAGIIWPHQANIQNGDSFDYVVIGSGAGSIVANRLTENPNISVLLLEAGDVPSVESILPGLFIELQNSYQDWQCRSEKELASQSQYENAFKISVGKSLGGSSCIHHFIYLRGNPNDYDTWAKKLEDPSWNYENILPYFIKAETVDDEEIMNSEFAKFHSDKGPIVLTRDIYKKVDNYLKSFKEVGKKVKIDLNGNDTEGYAQPLLTIGNKVRQSLAQAYIKPIVKRGNFYVSLKTLVTKINFDDNKTAKSVEMIKDGKKITIRARKEIVLCAGAINSPQILMLSGIGPKEHLESLNIPVIQDLPVGQNMQDHPTVQLVHKMKASLELPELPTLTKIPFPIIIGTVNINQSDTYPHYQTTNLVLPKNLPYINLACVQLLGYKDEICQALYDKSFGKNTFYTLLAHLQPKSRGEVKLRSSDPTDCPSISENFYSDERDLDDMVDFIVDFIKINKSKYFKDVNAELVKMDFEDCVGDFDDRKYIRCYVKHMTATTFHPVGTCSMGTVLDNRLKVKGVKRLRVVDASVFPTISRANTLATVVMVAEKASDLIKEDQNDLN